MLFTFIGLCCIFLKRKKNTPLRTKTFTLACLCFRLHDARLLDGLSMMGRHSTANLLVLLSPTMVKHPGLLHLALGMADQCVLPLISEDSSVLSCFLQLYLLLLCRKGTAEGSWPTATEGTRSLFLRISASIDFPDLCLFTRSSVSLPPQGHGSSKICADASKFSCCSKSADLSEIAESGILFSLLSIFFSLSSPLLHVPFSPN